MIAIIIPATRSPAAVIIAINAPVESGPACWLLFSAVLLVLGAVSCDAVSAAETAALLSKADAGPELGSFLELLLSKADAAF